MATPSQDNPSSTYLPIEDYDLISDMHTYAPSINSAASSLCAGQSLIRRRSLPAAGRGLLTHYPTEAIIASTTSSLPESIGSGRNWDYREKAEAYMALVYNQAIPSISHKVEEPVERRLLPIVVEMESDLHTQLDTSGALLDRTYLYGKFAGPVQYDQWCYIRRIVDHIMAPRHEPDMSVREVRGEKRNFVFSKIILWVALDWRIQLANKRSNLPCPNRIQWTSARDKLYEEIVENGCNNEGSFFCMSCENRDVLDAAVLVAPLDLLIAPDDPRFLSTLEPAMEAARESGFYEREYGVSPRPQEKVHDGRPRLPAIREEMMPPGQSYFYATNPQLIKICRNASTYFDNVRLFATHVGIFSEEVNSSGERVGNTPQAFSHPACSSTAISLARK
ncbi:Six-hairpin glycosidase-like protein [Aspergillus recurvatus]